MPERRRVVAERRARQSLSRINVHKTQPDKAETVSYLRM
jgi:hypothetical protein